MAVMQQTRIVSLIASATEIVCALGRRDWLVGRSHECDFPADVLALPALTAPKFKVEGTSAEIDARVQADRARRAVGLSRRRRGAAGAGARRDRHAGPLRGVRGQPERRGGRHLHLDGHAGRDRLAEAGLDCADVYADIRRVARALDAAGRRARRWSPTCRRGIEAVSARVAGRPRPRVAFIEWVEPLMAGGNWMPELIEAAGGDNLFGAAGKHSDWMQWDELVAADPDVIVVAPCGYGLARCLEELPLLQAKPGWADMRPCATGRVYFADGNAYFNRPGPRLADSTEMLAEMLHPEVAEPVLKGTAWVAPVR